jgi:ribonucleoside-diphosphate reductase beta chain
MNNSLFLDASDRFSLFPVKNQQIWKLYKKMVSVFWIPEEIDLSNDINDWNKLTDGERLYITNILGFFATADSIIDENLIMHVIQEIKLPEARCLYIFQTMMENIHAETYAILLDTYIKDSTLKNKLFNAIETIPCIACKADWALNWIKSDASFAERIIYALAIEAIFFAGSFCAIFWIRAEKKILPGLCYANELISRDEGMHCDTAQLIYSLLDDKLPELQVSNIIKSAVECEIQFVTESLPVALIGMNAGMMIEYIKFVADRVMVGLGYNKIYNSNNPFDFMEMISLDNKSNFFERDVGEYKKSMVDRTLGFDEDC